MTRWEYRTVAAPADLDALGRAGWELVAVASPTPGAGAIFYFKRPAPDFRDRVTAEQKARYYAQRGLQAAVGPEAGP